MCNRYRPASVVRIRDVFGWTHIESGPITYKPAVGPWQHAPFVTARALRVGQWGLIPWFSKTQRPTGKTGRPISTNNCRTETVATAPTFRDAWKRGQRCLIPAEDYDEPYWGTGRNIWWRFRRADGAPWALAGVWSDWTHPETGEIVPSFTMLTCNCDAHPVLRHMHKPDPALPAHAQDKRSVVSVEREHWEQWLHGTPDEAMALVRAPACELLSHGAADPLQEVPLPAGEGG